MLFGGVDDPHAVFEALLERGILIREIGLPGCLRVTAGTEAETTRVPRGDRRVRAGSDGVLRDGAPAVDATSAPATPE